MFIRIAKCACGNQEEEVSENAGFPGWGQLMGVQLNGMSNPHLCPTCLAVAAGAVDEHMEEIK